MIPGRRRVVVFRTMSSRRTDNLLDLGSETAPSPERACPPRGLGHAPTALELASDARWFRVRDEAAVEIRRRHLLRSLLLTLVTSHRDSPGRSLTTQELIVRVWPGDRIPHTSARNRLYFAMNALRSMGLRDVVVRSSGGYAIAKDVVVRFC